MLKLLTLSCLKKHNIFNSRKTLLQETKFWKTLGIFLSATLFPSRGSVTDLQNKRFRTSHTTVSQLLCITKEYFSVLIIVNLDSESKQCNIYCRGEKSIKQGCCAPYFRLYKMQRDHSLIRVHIHIRRQAWVLLSGSTHPHPCVCCLPLAYTAAGDQQLEPRGRCDHKHLHLPRQTLLRVKHV